jgi:zinc/manganese transport system substrate-binding protein
MSIRSLCRGTVIACLLAIAWTIMGQAEAKPVRVVATFTILGDMVRQVGGDGVQVTTLVGPNGDAHVYEPTPADAKSVAEADLLVVNGLGMEGWMKRLSKAASYKGPVVVASKGVKTRQMVEDGRTETDPHAWQDLANGKLYVANIAAGLAKVDPADSEVYRANADRYSRELSDLDAWVRAEIGAVPPAKRKVITSHDAFGYFGRAYGVTFLAPEGISTETEISAKDLAKLVTQIRQTRIKAIFMENMSDPRLIEQLAKEAGAAVGGTLYVDALSQPDGPAATYVAMFRHNVPQLKAAMLKN